MCVNTTPTCAHRGNREKLSHGKLEPPSVRLLITNNAALCTALPCVLHLRSACATVPLRHIHTHRHTHKPQGAQVFLQFAWLVSSFLHYTAPDAQVLATVACQWTGQLRL